MKKIRRKSKEWKALLEASSNYRFYDNGDMPCSIAPFTPSEYAHKNDWTILEKDELTKEVRLTGANFIYKWSYQGGL